MSNKIENEIIIEIKNTLAFKDDDHFQKAIYKLESQLSGHPFFPESVFSSLIDILESSDLLSKDVGFISLFSFFKGFVNDLKEPQLDETQKSKLGDSLERLFPKVQHAAMGMLCIELIIDILNEERALEVLTILNKNDAENLEENPRALLPYGLSYFISNSQNTVYRNKAFKFLRLLLKDNNKYVQHEASIYSDSLS